MKHRNPCIDCPSSHGGCGKHGSCEPYLAFREENLARSKDRHSKAILNDYTTKEVMKSKKGRTGLYRLRPKDRW